ncbi:MAG: P-loop NTPase [Anaerolineales bacterium]
MSMERPLEGMRIGVVGKGGAGKSNLTVLVASALRRRSYEVCILDADSTNVGLHQALGLNEMPGSLIDYFGGMVFSGGAVSCPVDDPTPLHNAELNLERIPARFYGRNTQGITLLTAGKIGDLGPGAGCDGPINKIARDVQIRRKGITPVTLVDFKAGFEDSARGAVVSLDWILAVVDPTHAAVQMALHMKNMVEQLQAGAPPATEHLEREELRELARTLFREAKIRDVLVVLNRVRDEEMESYLRGELHKGGLTPVAVIHEDPGLTLAWLKGAELDGPALQEAAEVVVTAIEDAARELSGKPVDSGSESRG